MNYREKFNDVFIYVFMYYLSVYLFICLFMRACRKVAWQQHSVALLTSVYQREDFADKLRPPPFSPSHCSGTRCVLSYSVTQESEPVRTNAGELIMEKRHMFCHC